MPALPTGTVTLLFTDVEASTRILQQLGDRYAKVLEEHRNILRTAFVAHNGSEVDTQGDAFFVAFERATDALMAAVAAQRAIIAHEWPDDIVVAVRMGLHTGQPRLIDHRYVGLDVHRASRIAAAAHGTQVLLSRTSADLVEDDLPDGMLLVDLGAYRLRNLDRPERIYQVVAPGLPAEFPPLNALETLPNNLPIPVAGLIGSGDETLGRDQGLASTAVEPVDIIKAVRERMQLESLTPGLKLVSPEYGGNRLSIDGTNSLLFEFATLREQFPDRYSSASYKLLFSVALARESAYHASVLLELDRLRSRYNVDKIVLWSTVPVENETMQLLKRTEVDVIQLDARAMAGLLAKPLLNYLPLPGRPADYSVYVNHVAGQIVERLKKLFHLVLSEIAAPIYDEHYPEGRVATRAMVEFEEAKLRDLLARMKSEERDAVGLDIGCGTGRYSFLMARTLNEVYAYDFSPRMIDVANRLKRERGDTRISFAVNDVEYEQLADEDRFYGRVDLVLASSGMGSFVEDTVRMLRRFQDWLKPGGYVFLSFYNENSLALKLEPNWRDSALAANLDPDHGTLRVELPGGANFSVFCRPYNEGTKGEINKLFHIDTIYTYPTTMALMPNSFLRDDLARTLFGEIDDLLADNATLRPFPQLRRNYGHYVLVVAHKPRGAYEGYLNIIRALASRPDIEYEIIEHGPVLSVEDEQRELGKEVPLDCIVKTLIFKLANSRDYVSISVAADKMIDTEALAHRLGVAKSRIKFAAQKEVAELGFPLGGIAPFGFSDRFTVRRFVDAGLREAGDWIYTGIGDNRRTLKLRKRDFLDLVSRYEWLRL